jgi:hypothetical protein
MYDGTLQLIATNDDWGGGAEIAAAANSVGAFPVAAASKDAALLLTLNPGLYSAKVGSLAGEGVVLIEAYDADSSAESARFVNLSVRANAGTGENVLTAGFVVTGNSPKQILIRAIGPGLLPYGVGSVLADPELTVFKDRTTIAQNDNWGGSAAFVADFDRVGAFHLASDSLDAAVVITVAPGLYTAQAGSAKSGTGVALLEVYELR